MRVTRTALVAAAAALALALLLAGCGSSTPGAAVTPPALEPTVVPAVSDAALVDWLASGDFSSFAEGLRAAGLQKLFGGRGPYTLFVPDDQAVSSISFGQLMKDLPHLKSVIQYHIIKGTNVKMTQATNGASFTTLEGEAVTFHWVQYALVVDDTPVTQVIEGADWTIYVVYGVLTPPSLRSASPTASASP